jgi:hypothetical protein
MVTLITDIIFFLFTCMHYWVWGILQRWYTCAPAAYEVVRNCRSFDIGTEKGDLSERACRIPKLWNLPTKVHGAKTQNHAIFM